MANYSGLVPVDITSFQAFQNATLGNGYNVDYLFGFQCVDLPKLLTGNAGRTSPYWKSGNSGYAREGWTDITSREYNKGNLFTLVYNKADIKAGDIVILNATNSNPYGHVAFATTDWNANTTSAILLGQNQVNPDPDYGHVTTLTNVNVTTFLGGFRFNAWQPTPPTPTPTYRKSHFKWVLYARKIRNKNTPLPR